jgi:hypothetical protein
MLNRTKTPNQVPEKGLIMRPRLTFYAYSMATHAADCFRESPECRFLVCNKMGIHHMLAFL